MDSYWDFLPEEIQLYIKVYTPHPLTKVLKEGINWFNFRVDTESIVLGYVNILDSISFLAYTCNNFNVVSCQAVQ